MTHKRSENDIEKNAIVMNSTMITNGEEGERECRDGLRVSISAVVMEWSQGCKWIKKLRHGSDRNLGCVIPVVDI